VIFFSTAPRALSYYTAQNSFPSDSLEHLWALNWQFSFTNLFVWDVLCLFFSIFGPRIFKFEGRLFLFLLTLFAFVFYLTFFLTNGTIILHKLQWVQTMNAALILPAYLNALGFWLKQRFGRPPNE
jgi:hypothetical protein